MYFYRGRLALVIYRCSPRNGHELALGRDSDVSFAERALQRELLEKETRVRGHVPPPMTEEGRTFGRECKSIREQPAVAPRGSSHLQLVDELLRERGIVGVLAGRAGTQHGVLGILLLIARHVHAG